MNDTLPKRKQNMEEMYQDDIFAYIGFKYSHMGYWLDDNSDDFHRAQEDNLIHLLHPLNIQPGDRVLDIGGGQGGTAVWMAKRYDCNVVIVDIVENMIKKAREAVQKSGLENRIDARCLDILELEEPAESFDHVVSVEALHHITDKETLFKKIASLLKPGGKFAASIDLCDLNLGVLRRIYLKLVLGDEEVSPLDHYVEAIKKSNLDHSETEDISDAVFPKSTKILRQEPYYSRIAEYHQKYYGRIATWLFPLFTIWHNSILRKKQLRLVICRAQKTSRS